MSITHVNTEDGIRAAQRSGDTEREVMLCLRARKVPEVSFVVFYTALLEVLRKAKRACSRLERKGKRFVHLRAKAAGYCHTCRGTGIFTPVGNWSTGSDWRMNDPRPCHVCRTVPGVAYGLKVTAPYSAETEAKADEWTANRPSRYLAEPVNRAELCASLEAEVIYGPLFKQANAVETEAQRRLAPYNTASAITVGAEVMLTNKRARPTFANSFLRVPQGTCGVVIRVSYGNEEHTDQGARLCISVDNAQGADWTPIPYWTKGTNVSTVALNGWTRLLGIDAHSVKTKAKADKDATVQAEQEAAGELLKRGDKVAHPAYGTRKLKVFWVGKCRTTGKQKWGIGKTVKATDKHPAGPFWGGCDCPRCKR